MLIGRVVLESYLKLIGRGAVESYYKRINNFLKRANKIAERYNIDLSIIVRRNRRVRTYTR